MRFTQRTEATRERDVVKHLLPWTELYHPGTFQPPPFADTAYKKPCRDTALLAFAQLVTWRLGYRRSFVSLLSTDTEYVLAEATQTMSFQHSLVTVAEDRPWIGTCAFPSTDSLAALALGVWRTARCDRGELTDRGHYYTTGLTPHYHIVSDIKRSPECQDNMFTQRASWARFYFAVPLRTAHGSIIGSLCVVDDRPRYGVSVDEMSFMEDLADTVTEHFHSTVVRAQRQRSERLIQALTLFNRGEDSLRYWWLRANDDQLLNAGRHADNTMSLEDRTALGDEKFGVYPTSFRTSSRTSGSANRDTDTDRHNSPSSTTDKNSNRNHPANVSRRPTKPSQSSSFNLTEATNETYARASNLMREALEAHGVAFVDISSMPLRRDRRDPSQSNRRSSTNETSQSQESSEVEQSDIASETKASCNVHGCSLREGEVVSSRDSAAAGRLDFPKSYLEHLLIRYPQGHIFNFGGGGGLVSSGDGESMSSGSDQAATKVRDKRGFGRRLRSVMANARTIAFYPLRDNAGGRWRSGLFVWSTSPLRFFDEQEDLTYLSSFGHSLMAELSRLEALATNKAKEAFVSSISHELRSPLHGVLAGVEFLQETELTTFQQEMSHTILKAGRTLLDTINHLLDYSKISNFRSSSGQRRAKADAIHRKAGTYADPTEIGVTSNVDLAQLTEDLVETVVSAHRFQYHSRQSSHAGSGTPGLEQVMSQRFPSSMQHATDVAIVLNIAPRRNWYVAIQSGSWTRIVCNLVGNALKYTEKGTISVSLGCGQTGGSTSDVETVSLIVEDTGIGISDSFLGSELYTPFRQEDSLSTGSGLGLAIVKQIADELEAHLNITSEIGRGTRAELIFQPTFVEGLAVGTSGLHEATWSQDSQSLGLDVLCHVERDQAGQPTDNSQHAQSCDPITQSVLKTSHDWLGCKIIRGLESVPTQRTTVFTITEQDAVALGDPSSVLSLDKLDVLAKKDAHLLILGGSMRLKFDTDEFIRYGIRTAYVPSPIGPRKLLRAVAHALNLDRKPTSPGHTPGHSSAMQEGTIEVIGSLHWSDSVQQTSDGRNASRPTFRLQRQRHKEASPDESTLRSTPRSQSPSGPSASGSKASPSAREIMLVEDNHINMKLLVALAKKLELPYQCAVNGREALEMYRKSPAAFFLILMDLSMPVMDGHTSTAGIRKLEKELHVRPTTIVALTGVTNEESKQRAFDSGVDEYFTKPIHMRDIKKLIEAVRTS